MPSQARPKRRSRRRFLIAASVLGGAFYLGYRFASKRDRLARPLGFKTNDNESALTGWLKIAVDGTITVAIPRQDMGQGIYTALAMLVAEELDADWRNVRAEQAPVDPLYGNITLVTDGLPFGASDDGTLARIARWGGYQLGDKLGVQATGGSTSVRDAWQPMRLAGAAAREMLLQAAAQRWNVSASECATEESFVLHGASGKRLSYGEIASDAARITPPQQPTLKDPKKYRLIGQSVERLDVTDKCNGSAQYGIDVRLPGMLYAAIAHCSQFGGKVQSVDAGKVKGMRGIQRVVNLGNAVAVVADRYWDAQAALSILPIVWSHPSNTTLSTDLISAQYNADMENGYASNYRDDGDADAALNAAAKTLEADYRAPFLAHATMEPINCTARVADGGCEVWLGNQAPSIVRWIAGKTAGVDSDKVTVHTPYLGGGFGRRVETDVVVEAITIAKQLDGKAVQVIWSREEDLQHDVYRPGAIAKFRAALDAQGNVTALWNRIVGPSVSLSLMERLVPWAAFDLMQDKTNAEGAADMPYAVANLKVEHVLSRTPVPVGFWRSVGHSYNAFFKESFIDELAHATGKDPVAYRASLLANHPRHLKVLQTAAEKAGWNTPPESGIGRGIALHESFRSIVAQVAEVALASDGSIRVKRVVCAIDCGLVIHPATVVAQMESGIIFGLTAALHGEITFADGRVQQSNFHDYPMLRMPQTPVIETHIVDGKAPVGGGANDSMPPLDAVESLPPGGAIERMPPRGAAEPMPPRGAVERMPPRGGVGEPGTPPIAPAVANAIFALTGKRLRSLPLR